MVVSSGDAGYGFLVDEEGRLRQAGFGPEIGAHMARLSAKVPAAAYPLAYPAYDEEILRAPALRVTHGDGTTTTRLRVEDVRGGRPLHRDRPDRSGLPARGSAVLQCRRARRAAPVGHDHQPAESHR